MRLGFYDVDQIAEIVADPLAGGGLAPDPGGGIQREALTGDVTAAAGSNTTTLATVNANVGTFGSATKTVTVTFNAKGLATAAAEQTVTPAASSLTGLGTGVATALAVNVGSAGAFVTFNGALGTPSSGTLTNASGLPIAGLVASTSTAIGVGSVELGHASDTTITRTGAGDIAVEGKGVYRADGTDVALADGGTGSSTLNGAISALRNAAMVKKAADQTGADYTGTGQFVAWDSEVYDDNSWHDNVTNNTRLTVPSGVSRVRVGGAVRVANGTAGVQIQLTIQKNASANFDGNMGMTATTFGATSLMSIASGPISVSAGDYFELLLAYSTTDTSIDITAARSNFWIEAC
jgi:hypothetical protein